MTYPVPSEQIEQMRFVQWLELKGYKFTSIPNSTYTKSWSQKRKNTEMGLRAGFPDMIVVANNVFMCIELKRTKGGTLSEFQKEWICVLGEANIPVAVCKGADEAIRFVQKTAGLQP